MTATTCDVLVVGGGNAALCAALAARERHVEVLMLVWRSLATRVWLRGKLEGVDPAAFLDMVNVYNAAAREARVLDTEDRPIKGLYAPSELVGGSFYVNAPAGAGLTSGAVFDRIAGGGTVNGADREAGR